MYTSIYDLYPLINGLSDNDAQLLKTNKVQKHEKECHTYLQKKKKNRNSIADFQLKLSQETWELVFDGNDVNKVLNSFLNIFFYSSFLLIQLKNKINQHSWITAGLITSCQHKRELIQEIKE
jgi:hypothetical protein